MTTCKIDWWVNNVFQGTVTWNGSIRDGQTANVFMGNYNFSYPPDEVNFAPFNMRFTVKDANNKNPDADPNNDTYVVNTSPNLNDAGAIGFFGPPEGFGAGVTPVRARILNYAPKPLSSVTVHWKVDGVEQTPVTFNNISIPQNQFQDLNMGTFLFYNKTPLGPFAVEVWTSNPNGVADENTSNDKYTGGIGPSLAAGTYFAGGANAHFSSPAEAASYINSSGVFGPGDVNIEIRPGVYNGQIVLNNQLANNNKLTFRSSTNRAMDVHIIHSPSPVINYVLQVSNINNVRFENITFQNNNNNTSNAGKIFDVTNVDGFQFHKVVLNGVSNAPKTAAYNLLTLMNCDNIMIHESDFNNGSASIWSNTGVSPKFTVDKNSFSNFTWYGVYSHIGTGSNDNNVNFVHNSFRRSLPGTANGAIYSFNGSVISNNVISDITGAGNSNDAFIRVEHSAPSANHVSWIENNTITNCTNMNGIKVNNAYAIINRNLVVMAQSSNFGAALMDFSGAAGAVGNNMMMGTNIMAFDVENSPMLYIIYNTSSVEFNGNPAMRLSGSLANIMRNIVVNKGSGVALHTPGVATIDQNIFFSSGTNLANIGGMNYANMSAIHDAGLMLASSQVNVEFFSPSDPHLKTYNGALLFETPLFTEAGNWNGWYVENADYDSETRGSFYAGADEIFLDIYVERQTDGFVDCIGSTTNILTVSAAIGYNAPMTYQWMHDGSPISGETEPILYFPNLRHQQAGVYTCKVMGPGNTEPVYSRPVAVYVTRPTDITRHPLTQGIFVGTVATLSFDAHVNGKNIEEAIANDEVKVQWYRYIDETTATPLVDNARISGAKSNYLTFRDFRSADEGEYFARIDGLCGMVQTERARLTEENLEIQIVNHPTSVEDCVNDDVTFTVEATTKSTLNITYQWYKDNAMINDNAKYTGTKTRTLTVKGIAKTDEGRYHAVVRLAGTEVSVQSAEAALTVKVSPKILLQPQDAVVENGKQLLLDVIAEGSYDEEVLTYKWYKNGTLVLESNDQYYIVDVTTPDDAGDYYVEVSNDCGSIQSETVTVTITTGASSVFEVSKNGFSLSTAVPNPVSNNSVISFGVPSDSHIKITLSDASGAGNITLAEGIYSAGTYTININASQYNLASGTYFYFLESNGVRLAQKLVVIR